MTRTPDRSRKGSLPKPRNSAIKYGSKKRKAGLSPDTRYTEAILPMRNCFFPPWKITGLFSVRFPTRWLRIGGFPVKKRKATDGDGGFVCHIPRRGKKSKRR